MTLIPGTLSESLWFRRFEPRPDAGVRLICLPHAGGAAPFFVPLARALDEVDVVAVQYPGRQDRRSEPCIDDLMTLADQVFAALGGLLDQPVALFGHSMGATLAFEVARRMEAAGTVPRRLFASGRRAPSTFRADGPTTLTDQQALAEMAQLSGTDPRLLREPDVVRMALPPMKADFHAAETYRLTEDVVLGCPVTVLTGDDDPRTSLPEARAWQRHTGDFELCVYPGGHFFLTEHRAEVARVVADRLGR
jgi:surfactin synthase thioesterase subunit